MKPKLIHTIDIEIANIDRTQTQESSIWNEPKRDTGGVKYSAAFIVKGQVSFNNFDRLEANEVGFEKKGDGYLLVDRDHADTIDVMAKISMMDNESVEYYVREKMPMTVYGSAHFAKIIFESKTKGI